MEVEVIPGLEISAEHPGGSMHLLGYFIDPEHPFLNRELLRLQEARQERNPKIIDKLRSLGLSITLEQVQALARKYPEQVLHIFIRAVEKESPSAERFRKAFEGLPRERWRVFTDPGQLKNVKLPIAASTRPAVSTRSSPAGAGVSDR